MENEHGNKMRTPGSKWSATDKVRRPHTTCAHSNTWGYKQQGKLKEDYGIIFQQSQNFLHPFRGDSKYSNLLRTEMKDIPYCGKAQSQASMLIQNTNTVIHSVQTKLIIQVTYLSCWSQGMIRFISSLTDFSMSSSVSWSVRTLGE